MCLWDIFACNVSMSHRNIAFYRLHFNENHLFWLLLGFYALTSMQVDIFLFLLISPVKWKIKYCPYLSLQIWGTIHIKIPSSYSKWQWPPSSFLLPSPFYILTPLKGSPYYNFNSAKPKCRIIKIYHLK